MEHRRLFGGGIFRLPLVSELGSGGSGGSGGEEGTHVASREMIVANFEAEDQQILSFGRRSLSVCWN